MKVPITSCGTTIARKAGAAVVMCAIGVSAHAKITLTEVLCFAPFAYTLGVDQLVKLDRLVGKSRDFPPVAGLFTTALESLDRAEQESMLIRRTSVVMSYLLARGLLVPQSLSTRSSTDMSSLNCKDGEDALDIELLFEERAIQSRRSDESG